MTDSEMQHAETATATGLYRCGPLSPFVAVLGRRCCRRLEKMQKLNTDTTVRATVFKHSFTGRIISEGHDQGGHYVVINDHNGRDRMVRPDHPEHDLRTMEVAR
jgi:hypothetical protein